MIGKGRSISSTKASIEYGANLEKDSSIIYRNNIAGEQPQEIAQEFKMIQDLNEKCERNTMSFILSPTVEDGLNLTDKKLGEIADKFIKEMKLENHQSIAFVHKDKSHKHIHLYCNRIDFNGKAYNDSFLGKRSAKCAEKVAETMGLKTVREVQQEKLNLHMDIRLEIRNQHTAVMENTKPKNLDEYIKQMASKNIEVIPSINKSNQLQGFRFKYNQVNLKGSEIHRSMSGSKIINDLAQNNRKPLINETKNMIQIMDKGFLVSPNILRNITKTIAKQILTKGIEF